MKTRIKNLSLQPALIAGLGLMLAGRVTAQNFTAWPVTRIAAGGYHTLLRGRMALFTSWAIIPTGSWGLAPRSRM